MRVLAADGSPRLVATDHALALESPSLDLIAASDAATAPSEAESGRVSSVEAALRLGRLGARLRATAADATAAVAAAAAALELELNPLTGAVFLGHRASGYATAAAGSSGSGESGSRGPVEAGVGAAGSGNVTLAASDALEAFAFGPGGAALVALRGPLVLAAAQRATLSTVRASSSD